MSYTVDVFIKFQGSKASLLKILETEFMIPVRRRESWLFAFIQLDFASRSEDGDYFRGSRLRPYNYVLGGTTYAWSSQFGCARHADTAIFDALAQVLAVRLKTRTMVAVLDWGEYRRYRYVRSMKRNKYSAVVDEESGKVPKGLF